MKHIQLVILLVGFLFSCIQKEREEEKTTYLTSDVTKMAAPMLECKNLFFTDSVEVSMKFSLPGAIIKYTLDGSAVTDASKTYKTPLVLDKTTLIKARNFHPEFQTSLPTSMKVIQTNTKLVGSQIEVSPEPNERYKGNGTAGLIDHIKGTASFANGNAWLGFQAESIQIDINLYEVQTLSKVTVSSIVNHGAWIFLPKKITIFSGTQEVGTVEIQAPTEKDTSKLEFIEIPIKENTYKNLKIMVSSVSEIPEWHQGKGTVAWFFVDELLVE